MGGTLHCLPRDGFRPEQPWFVTLTYRADNQWHANHIAEAMDRYRAWCGRRGVACRYVWVAELTTRGRVHYHLIAWLPHGVRMTFWDRPRRVKGKRTVAFWTHGTSRTEKAKYGVSYLMKYLSKMGELHEFPEGLRLYGMGGLTREQRQIRSWSNLPGWVKRTHGVGEVRRISGALVHVSTGEILPPMYRRQLVPGGLVLHELRQLPPKLYDHGPFSTYPRP